MTKIQEGKITLMGEQVLIKGNFSIFFYCNSPFQGGSAVI